MASPNNGPHDGGWDWFSPVAAEALSVAAGETVEAIEPGDHLLDDLGLDSFGVLVFLMELEERLGVELTVSDAEPVLQNIYRLASASGAWTARP